MTYLFELYVTCEMISTGQALTFGPNVFFLHNPLSVDGPRVSQTRDNLDLQTQMQRFISQ